MNWLMGLLASSLIAGLAYWKRSLTFSGVLGAILIGTILYGAGNIGWYGVLLAFFLSSTLLTKWRQASKAKWEAGYEKTGRRDFGQVMANGGLAAFLCLIASLYSNGIWYAGFLGVMSTVTADTWATEIGSLSKQAPRSILTGKKATPGTSGAISLLGLLASAAGGCLIGLVGVVFNQGPVYLSYSFLLIVICTISGLCGSLLDSLMGATLQANYQCKKCGNRMEKRQHCNQPTELVHGYYLINNDLVNFISSIGGAVINIGLINLIR
ncbi:DUF92 domain-containing protein [Brevibacillus ginsengisoli]|uniref:DUF92 domain-containing protein n=1 Tax=Brevibacillus ginsengisoli TaxID=363854 RepID=UPI003CE7EE1B